ncbi:MAG: transposase zinc-binding domain-containing protein, partial [Candidatus Theseobacter exili]|nr:transposase zinc-binding domain-containing protein [Candidatus Theseobacter exili]
SYNSCRNRHCPKCQASKQAFWVEDVSERIVDTKYFHIVFTVPGQLNAICILDSRKFYNTLFSSVWQTLRTLGLYCPKVGKKSMRSSVLVTGIKN